MKMGPITIVRIYDYYPLERKLKVYVQVRLSLQLAPFGSGKTSLTAELPEYKGEAHNVDGCRFLNSVGDNNRAGKMISIEFVEVEDE
jgi:hypothetical protein